MRQQLLPGAALAVAGALVVLLGSWLQLEIDAVVVLGVALGGVVGLVGDRTPVLRAAAFLSGLAVCGICYLLRAALLPDAAAGRAVFVFLVLLLCVGIATVSIGHLPLWAVLAGVAALAGSYEAAYSAAPSRVLETAPGGVTTVLLTAAVGFCVTALLSALPAPSGGDHVEVPDDDNVFTYKAGARP